MSFRPTGCTCISMCLLLWCAAVPVMAGVSMDITRGSAAYYQQSLTADFSLSPAVYLAVVHSRSNSSDALAPTVSYTVQSIAALAPHFSLGVTGTVSPETVVTRAAGIGVSGTWTGGRPAHLSWSAGVRCSGNQYAEDTAYTDDTGTAVSEWLDLTQTVIEPFCSLTLRRTYTASFGIIGYSYDRELSDFSSSLAALEELLPAGTGMSALVSGFPGSIVHAGLSAGIGSNATVWYEWSRMVYAASQEPDESSSAIGCSISVLPILELRGSWNTISTGSSYYSCGMRWMW